MSDATTSLDLRRDGATAPSGRPDHTGAGEPTPLRSLIPFLLVTATVATCCAVLLVLSTSSSTLRVPSFH